MTLNPFDAQRDEALGRLLREGLTPGDPDRFVRRVLAALPAERNSWEVLASWAQPRLAAALLLISVFGWALGLLGTEGEGESASTQSVLAGEVLGESAQPAPEELVGVVLGIR